MVALEPVSVKTTRLTWMMMQSKEESSSEMIEPFLQSHALTVRCLACVLPKTRPRGRAVMWSNKLYNRSCRPNTKAGV